MRSRPDIPDIHLLSLARASCLVFASIMLGFAIHVNNGLVHPLAILWLTLAILSAFGTLLPWPDTSILFRYGPRVFPVLIAAGIFIQLALLFLSTVPGIAEKESRIFIGAFLVIAALLCAAMHAVPARSRLIFPFVLLVFAAIGVWMLSHGARPKIDVWTAQMAGLDAMHHGADPWSSTFADVYHLPDLYAPGTVRDGVVHLGFPYPPLTVLLDLPGYWLFKDYRYSNLAAMVVTAACIAYARPGVWGPRLAVLFLFTPRVFFVLANGWTEPTVAMLLAMTVFCACRAPRWIPWMLGLLLVSKQYMPLAAIPAILLLPARWRLRDALNLFAKAAICGLIVSLPLALWNYRAFLHSTLLVASGAKFRLDALSYFAFLANISSWTPTQAFGAVSYLAALATAAIVARRGEQSPAGFAAGVSLIFLVFFSLNKFAFCNYYYFIIAALCTAAAAAVGDRRVCFSGHKRRREKNTAQNHRLQTQRRFPQPTS